MPKNVSRPHCGPVSRVGSTYTRTRAAAACQVCRARRVKCDNERPCSNCKRTGRACSYDPSSTTSGFDPASLAILARLDEVLTEVAAISARPRTPPLRPMQHLTVPHQASPTDLPHLEGHLQQGNLGQVLAWDVWNHDPSLQGFTVAVADADQGTDTLTSREFGIGSGTKLDLNLFTGYLDAFFHNVHVLNPVLDESEIRSQLTSLLLDGIGWDASSCLLLLVLATGAASTSLTESRIVMDENRMKGENLFESQAIFMAAEKRKVAIPRNDYLTQSRCHFYSGVFMMMVLQPFDAWRHFLQGLATCQRLTRPRKSDTTASVAPLQAEESIYWSCWKSERELRFELNLPDFGAAGYDHPILYPTLPSQMADQKHLRAWYFYLAEISLWRLEMTARQAMAEHVKHCSSTFETLAEQVVDLESSLATWQASLPDILRSDADLRSMKDADVLLFVLKGRLTYNYEVLTWPFVERLILLGGPSDGHVGFLAAQGVKLHYDRLAINRPGFYHRHHGTWLMAKSSARSVLVLLAVSKSPSPHLLPIDWQRLVTDTIEMLEYWHDGPEKKLVYILRSLYSSITDIVG